MQLHVWLFEKWLRVAIIKQGGHVLADMKFPVFSLCFPCVAEIFPVFFIEELTVIVIKEMSLAPSYTIYFLLKPYTA